jgi:hypothetical protein
LILQHIRARRAKAPGAAGTGGREQRLPIEISDHANRKFWNVGAFNASKSLPKEDFS